jgi:hypothetical protein
MRHPEEEQVTLDVDRAFVFYPRFNDDEDDVAERKRDELKQKLQQLICLVLRKTPQLSYYQGYHDIAQVILLVYDMDVTKAAPVLDYISRHFLRDYMLPHIEGTIDILKLIPPILTLGDPYLGKWCAESSPFTPCRPSSPFCRITSRATGSSATSLTIYSPETTRLPSCTSTPPLSSANARNSRRSPATATCCTQSSPTS